MRRTVMVLLAQLILAGPVFAGEAGTAAYRDGVAGFGQPVRSAGDVAGALSGDLLIAAAGQGQEREGSRRTAEQERDPGAFEEKYLLQGRNGNDDRQERSAGDGNIARIDQRADGNSAGQYQFGGQNSALITQNTAFNAATQYQRGNGNSAAIAQ